jgi:hypothetical protein
MKRVKDSDWKLKLKSLNLSDLLMDKNYDVIIHAYNITDLEKYYESAIEEENYEIAHEIYLLFNEMNWSLIKQPI